MSHPAPLNRNRRNWKTIKTAPKIYKKVQKNLPNKVPKRKMIQLLNQEMSLSKRKSLSLASAALGCKPM